MKRYFGGSKWIIAKKENVGLISGVLCLFPLYVNGREEDCTSPEQNETVIISFCLELPVSPLHPQESADSTNRNVPELFMSACRLVPFAIMWCSTEESHSGVWRAFIRGSPTGMKYRPSPLQPSRKSFQKQNEFVIVQMESERFLLCKRGWLYFDFEMI